MIDTDNIDSRVKEANRVFYDAVAEVYEEIDGRRNDEMISWIASILKRTKDMTSGEVLLDLGCGSGVVMKSGKGLFEHIYGIDISPGILKSIKEFHVVCGECSFIPLKDESVDVAVCFSTLHHIYDHKPLFNEVYRVLKKGGALYTDHDMDKYFTRNFYYPLKLYRRFANDMEERYVNSKKEITHELYKLSEIHSDGVDSLQILEQLKETGFRDIKPRYHWYGLSGFFNALMGNRNYTRGFAPSFSVLARR